MIRQILFSGFILVISILHSGCAECSRSGRYSNEGADRPVRESIDRPVQEAERTPVEPSASHDRPAVTTSRPEMGQTLSELYQESGPAVFTILAVNQQGGLVQGSGFFLSDDGIAISNYHVLEGVLLNEAEIHLEDGGEVRIKEILARNSVEDYIVFKVVLRHEDFPYLPVAPLEAEIGEKVFAIGTPRGLEQTLSEGIISGYRGSRAIIQTTAEIAPGSSGGPLLNMRGEVIGITTATLGEANLNFAVNVNLLHLARFLN